MLVSCLFGKGRSCLRVYLKSRSCLGRSKVALVAPFVVWSLCVSSKSLSFPPVLRVFTSVVTHKRMLPDGTLIDIKREAGNL